MPKRQRTRAEKEQLIAEQVEAEREERLQRKALRLRSGDKNPLEEETEKILAKGRKVCRDDSIVYLSREQEMLRKNREVYNSNGIPDSSLVSGLYRRIYNPLMGQRPGNQKSSDD